MADDIPFDPIWDPILRAAVHTITDPLRRRITDVGNAGRALRYELMRLQEEVEEAQKLSMEAPLRDHLRKVDDAVINAWTEVGEALVKAGFIWPDRPSTKS
jgi:hypothetical protein